MSSSPFQDPRANDLLSRVSNDISLLRQDVGQLITHTSKHTLPGGARGLADTARDRLAVGRNYSAAQLRALRSQATDPTTAWIGGAVLVGLIAAGVYLLNRESCCMRSDDDYEDEEADL